jgi:hypothetical protein
MLKGFRDLGEDRTLDPLIKSQLLYRLSYQVIFCWVANILQYIISGNPLSVLLKPF